MFSACHSSWTEMGISVYKHPMAGPSSPFSSLPWTPDLVDAFGEAWAAIARLDARVSASSSPRLALAGQLVRLCHRIATQQFALEEIDIIAHQCAIRLAGRPMPVTASDPFGAYDGWLATLAQSGGRHWREDLPFTFDPPEGWSEALP
jgi:hypothetical protein